MLISAAIEQWLTYRAQLVSLGQLAESTLSNQRKIAAKWSAALGQLELVDLRKSHVDLAAAQFSQLCRPVTVQADVALLAQILNWCVDEQLLEKRPRLPTISVPHIEHDLPGDEAFVWVLRNVQPAANGNALEFMLLTGLAPHELERLEAGDFDEKRNAIGIGQRINFAVKTAARRRWVPLNERATTLWNVSTFMLEPTSKVFPTVAALEKAMQRARQNGAPVAGVDAVTPKMMRKWFASKLSGDVAEHLLQKLLGHSPGSRITRRHYVRSNAGQAEQAVEGLSITLEGKLP